MSEFDHGIVQTQRIVLMEGNTFNSQVCMKIYILHLKICRYYETAWRSAVKSGVSFISITSFNEWHEGTQIEPAVFTSGYTSYDPEESNYYLNLTRQFIKQMPFIG